VLTEVDFLSGLKAGDSCRAASYGTSEGSCFTALRRGRAPGLTCALQAVTASPAALATFECSDTHVDSCVLPPHVAWFRY